LPEDKSELVEFVPKDGRRKDYAWWYLDIVEKSKRSDPTRE